MNSLFGLIKRNHLKAVIVLVFMMGALTGCQNLPIKSRSTPKSATTAVSGGGTSEAVSSNQTAESTSEAEEGTDSAEATPEALPDTLPERAEVKTLPRFAFIFGPGGARAMGYVGILQELQKRKVPVEAVAGIEWGALVAGLYAHRGSVNDVQWQIGKLRTDIVTKKNFITRQNEPASTEGIYQFISEAVGSSATERTKVPFACPSFMLARQETFIMSKSALRDAMALCLPMSPILLPHKGYVAQPYDLQPLVQHLRSRGANFIVYVSVLDSKASRVSSLDTSSSMLWNLAGQKSLKRQGVDAVLSLPLNEYSIMDFDRSRDIMLKGSDMSRTLLDSFLNRWGL